MSSLIASPVQVHLEENSDSSFCGTRSHPASIQRKAFPFQHLLPVLKAAMYSSRSSTGHRYFCLGALRYLVSCHFSPLPCQNRFSAKTNTSDIILPPPLLFLFFFFFLFLGRTRMTLKEVTPDFILPSNFQPGIHFHLIGR